MSLSQNTNLPCHENGRAIGFSNLETYVPKLLICIININNSVTLEPFRIANLIESMVTFLSSMVLKFKLNIS